eukprot:m.230347 g.230347  ORF g.230347 m.230347 type:complete len:511 (-) comp33579_c0_seq1:74-1606(-)
MPSRPLFWGVAAVAVVTLIVGRYCLYVPVEDNYWKIDQSVKIKLIPKKTKSTQELVSVLQQILDTYPRETSSTTTTAAAAVTTAASSPTSKPCVSCQPCGVEATCGGRVVTSGFVFMMKEVQVATKEISVDAVVGFDAFKPPHVGRDKRNPNACMMTSEIWQGAHNTTPVAVHPDRLQQLNSPVGDTIKNFPTAVLIQTNSGNQGIFHGFYGMLSTLAFLRRMNVTLPLVDTALLMNAGVNDWMKWAGHRYTSKLKELDITLMLASAFIGNGSIFEPLATTYESYWTNDLKVPQWNTNGPSVIQFDRFLEGRTEDYTVADFAEFRRLVMHKYSITEAQCTSSPRVILMNRDPQRGGGRALTNMPQVFAETKSWAKDKFGSEEDVYLVNYGDLTPMQQITHAICAKAIIAPHGGGCTWAMFMSSGSRFIELFPSDTNQCTQRYIRLIGGVKTLTDYHFFAAPADLHYDCMLHPAESSGRGDWRNSNINVDIESFRQVLQRTKNESDAKYLA